MSIYSNRCEGCNLQLGRPTKDHRTIRPQWGKILVSMLARAGTSEHGVSEIHVSAVRTTLILRGHHDHLPLPPPRCPSPSGDEVHMPIQKKAAAKECPMNLYNSCGIDCQNFFAPVAMGRCCNGACYTLTLPATWQLMCKSRSCATSLSCQPCLLGQPWWHKRSLMWRNGKWSGCFAVPVGRHAMSTKEWPWTL